MYVRTKIADGLYVTEIVESRHSVQHIIETGDGFIIRMTRDKYFRDIRLTGWLDTGTSFQAETVINLPVGTYSSLRAALKLLAKMSKLHRRPSYA